MWKALVTMLELDATVVMLLAQEPISSNIDLARAMLDNTWTRGLE